jgi:group I intron endonuclease
MPASGIYMIHCLANGKRYVGQAGNIPIRLRNHRSALMRRAHQNRGLQAAWNKYGEAAFEFKPLLIVPISELTFYEQLLADFYRPHGLFNWGLFVDNGKRGRKLGPKARARIKAAVNTSEARAKKEVSSAGVRKTQRYRKNLAAGCARGWAENEARRAVVSAKIKAARSDPTRKAAWNSALAAAHRTPEAHEKLINRRHTMKTKRKMAAARRLYWQNKRLGAGGVEVPGQQSPAVT